MRRRERRRIVVSVCAGILVIWLVAIAWMLLAARSEAAAGAADLRHVRERASIAALVEPSSRTELASAQDHFAASGERLDSPILWPLRALPVVGRHIRAADTLVTGAEGGAAVADTALRDLTELTERPQREGPARVETLRDLATVAGRVDRALGQIETGSPDALVGPLSHAVSELGDQRSDARQAARRLQGTSLAIADVLEGPEPYLLLGANNAEMRNGSGMFLSASEISFDHGRMQLGPVRPTADLVLPAGSVAATPDLEANWPWLDPGRDLRNLGLTADFPQSAEVAVRNWAKVPDGGPVAGVIAIDVDAIRSLLRVVGPLEVDGVRYTADTVRGELLRKQYQRFADDRDARRDQLGEVARAIFERLESGKWKLEDLASELAESVQGRHLMVWSVDPTAAKAWHAVSADGHLTDRSLSVGLVNRSASKLDSWIDSSVDVSTRAIGRGRHAITISYDLVSNAPRTGPRYLVGPNVEGLAAGDHSALVVVNLPAGSTEIAMTGAQVFLEGGDGPTAVVAGRLTVRRGETAHVTVTAVTPAGVNAITIEPSARIERTQWTFDGEELQRDRRRTRSLGD